AGHGGCNTARLAGRRARTGGSACGQEGCGQTERPRSGRGAAPDRGPDRGGGQAAAGGSRDPGGGYTDGCARGQQARGAGTPGRTRQGDGAAAAAYRAALTLSYRHAAGGAGAARTDAARPSGSAGSFPSTGAGSARPAPGPGDLGCGNPCAGGRSAETRRGRSGPGGGGSQPGSADCGGAGTPAAGGD